LKLEGKCVAALSGFRRALLDWEVMPPRVPVMARVGKFFSVLLLAPGLAVCLGPVTSLAATAGAPGKRAGADLIDAGTVLIVDGNTGKVLFEKNANQPREVASVQKLVTAMVIAEAGKLDKRVTVTAQDASCPPTKLPNSVGGDLHEEGVAERHAGAQCERCGSGAGSRQCRK
jgi:D-alanyl-D-alanine carboxypeptidase